MVLFNTIKSTCYIIIDYLIIWLWRFGGFFYFRRPSAAPTFINLLFQWGNVAPLITIRAFEIIVHESLFCIANVKSNEQNQIVRLSIREQDRQHGHYR